MKIQLIVIGNELLNGKIQDKNTDLLSKLCYEYGHELVGVHFVQDEEKSFLQVFENSIKDAELIITSGGLGPTRDDITKSMLAKFFKKQIVKNDSATAICERQFKRMERTFDGNLNHYDSIPDGFQAIYNSVGFAPGLYFKEGKKIYLSLPGVPYEFAGMVRDFFETKEMRARADRTNQIIFKTWHIPEEKIFSELCPDLWKQLEQYGEVSSLPHTIGVDIGVVLKNLSDQEAVYDIVLNSPLKEYIWHIGRETLEEVIINEAQRKKLTIGFAESCTGGLNAHRITNTPGSSSVFWGSVVSYANEVKMKCLNVKEETLKEFGAVSKETALEMALGARKNLNVDIAISTTGIAGPGGATEGKPVGTVGIGISTKEQTTSDMYFMRGDRETLKMRFSQMALYKLLETIRSIK